MVTQDRGVNELLPLSASGDIDAYQELFNRYAEKLYNFIYYLTYSREEAEDIAQESFIKVYEAIQERDVSSFNYQAYLYKTAKNFALQAVARRKREGLTLDEAIELEETSISKDPERTVLLSEQRSKVESASRELTDEQEIALLLKELEGFPYDTIAEVLDSNTNAVGALLSRARLKFREVFRMAHAQTEGIPDTCARITPLLSKYLDKEASPDETLMIEAHLPECPICRENLASMKEASTTYRSLIPILPLATLKVWIGAKAALVGNVAPEAAGATAGTSTTSSIAAAGTAAEGGATVTATTVATVAGMGIAAKITTIAAVVLVVVGAGIGGYIGLKKTVFAKKKVPSITGQKVQEAKQRVDNTGLKLSTKYKYDYRTGNEVVLEQSIKAGTEVNKGTVLVATLGDKEFESARQQAMKSVSQANAALQEVQGMGIDTSDLAGPMQNAQSKLNVAKIVNELVGPQDSAVYWAGVVINGCEAKKQAHLAQKEREKQIENCWEFCINYITTTLGVRYDPEAESRINLWMSDDCKKAEFAYPPNRYAQGCVLFLSRNGDSWSVVDVADAEDHPTPPGFPEWR